MSLWGERTEVGMVDFVCVHRAYRGQRICPYLYEEARMRARAHEGLQKLVATSGDMVPEPFASGRYFHRVNPDVASLRKLIGCGFMPLPRRETIEQLSQRSAFCDDSAFPCGVELRPIVAEDVGSVRVAHNEYAAERFTVAHVFGTDEDFTHTFMPDGADDIVTFVAEARSDGDASDVAAGGGSDFISFYINNTNILLEGPWKGESIRTAYLFYCMPRQHSLEDLLSAAMPKLCSELNINVINALGKVQGVDEHMLHHLGFGPGTGVLKWYGCNFPPGKLDAEQVAWLTT